MAFYKMIPEEAIARDKFSLYVFVISTILILGQVFLMLTALGKLPQSVPLFYSRPWGEAMLAPSYFLWLLPAITLFTILANYSLQFVLIKEEKFLNKILTAFCLLVTVINSYNLVKIISLVS